MEAQPLRAFADAAPAKPGADCSAAPADQADAGNRAVLACADNTAFIQRLPDAGMKLIVTSPPYNLGKDYESRSPLDAWLAAQGTGDRRVRPGAASARLALLAGGELCGKRRDRSPRRPCFIPCSACMGSSCATGSFGISGTACTARSGFPAATRRSTGGRKATITPGTWTRFGFPPSIRKSVTSRGRTSASCRGIRTERIRATYGPFRT